MLDFLTYLEVDEAQKRGLKVPDKIIDFLWNCKYILVHKATDWEGFRLASVVIWRLETS